MHYTSGAARVNTGKSVLKKWKANHETTKEAANVFSHMSDVIAEDYVEAQS